MSDQVMKLEEWAKARPGAANIVVAEVNYD